MPRQLIYTSVPRGLTPGQSGYCTVARSRDLREALIPQLEKLSYYTPEPNYNPIICAHRIIDLRGAKFHILSRIADAGLDFTKRRSFLAHHLIFDPAEIQSAATPAEIFLEWQGWLHDWDRDPAWLEDFRPLPHASHRENTIAKSDVWITGDDTSRKNFVYTLARRGADWHITFTNCFQSGDDPDDFDLKAAWPGTPGFEAAKRLGANFVELDDLPAIRPSPKPSSAPSAPQLHEPPSAPPPRPPASRKLLPICAVAAAIVVFVIAASVRRKTPQPSISSPPPVDLAAPTTSVPQTTADIDLVLPVRPTWLVLPNHPTSVMPAENLLRGLRANEIFTKDLFATLQTNLLSPPIPATLFATPTGDLLRFTASNIPPVEISSANGIMLRSELSTSYSVEIPNRFRILVFKHPLNLPRGLLQIGATVELTSDFAARLHRIELPAGAQFALRPLVQSIPAWADPLAAAAREFAIVPSTILDLAAVQSHARKILASKESNLRAYEEEHARLAASQREILTQPTPEQQKAQDRLHSLELAITKSKRELEELRAKAAAIPKNAAAIDRFALFLCLSNVNTEIFRFVDTP